MTEKTPVGHCKRDSTDVYIGRGPEARDMSNTDIGERGWLGNPYTLDDYDREHSIETFEKHFVRRIMEDESFADEVADLSGKTLGCWCRTLDEDKPACHGDVISGWADRLAEGDTDD